MLLISKDGRHFLRLDLLPLSKPHSAWHGYSLSVGTAENGVSAELSTRVDNPLFLERAIEPEIPGFCDSLERLLGNGDDVAFAPVDEKDFTFRASLEDNDVRVCVDARHEPFGRDAAWPAGLLVGRSALEIFVAGLRLEYAQIMACCPM